MPKLAEFRELEKHLAQQVVALKGDSGLLREIEFEQKLRELLAEYSYSLRDIAAELDPSAATRRRPAGIAVPEKATRRARQIN